MKCRNCNYFKYDDSIYEYICDASLDKCCTDSDCHCSRLILPIKKKWFDMILSGEKKEEYREIKPYYDTRFDRAFRLKNLMYGEIITVHSQLNSEMDTLLNRLVLWQESGCL